MQRDAREENQIGRKQERGGLGPAPELKRKQTVTEGPPFWTDLPGLAAYPFRGSGVIRNLISAVFFAVVFTSFRGYRHLGPGGVMLGATLSVGVLGYISTYFISITRKTTENEPEPPDWPDFRSFPEMGAQFAGIFALCLLPLILPAALAAWAGYRMGGMWMFALPVMAAAPGLFYLPMALLAFAITGSLAEALNPVVVLSAISSCIGPYIALVPFVYGILAFLFAALVGTAFVPLSGLAFYFVSFYFFMVLFRLLGLFYLQCQVRLGWYTL